MEFRDRNFSRTESGVQRWDGCLTLSILTYNDRWSGQTSDRAIAGEAWIAIERRRHSFFSHLDTGMTLSAFRLGEALAIRLNEIVPGPIHVSVAPSSLAPRLDVDVFVLVAVGAEAWGGQGFSNVDLKPRGDVSLGDVACDMAVAMISGVQDSISRSLREPWPRLPTGAMALPDGRADSERIYLWYGTSEDRAAVTLRPVELLEISL